MGKSKLENKRKDMFIPKMKKDSTLVCCCGCHSEKSSGYPLDFYKKIMNFRGVTKRYHITFGAVEPNSINAKRNADTKRKF